MKNHLSYLNLNFLIHKTGIIALICFNMGPLECLGPKLKKKKNIKSSTSSYSSCSGTAKMAVSATEIPSWVPQVITAASETTGPLDAAVHSNRPGSHCLWLVLHPNFLTLAFFPHMHNTQLSRKKRGKKTASLSLRKLSNSMKFQNFIPKIKILALVFFLRIIGICTYTYENKYKIIIYMYEIKIISKCQILIIITIHYLW